jgi:hypothetical protein
MQASSRSPSTWLAWGAAAQAIALAAGALLVLPASWLLTEAPLALLRFALFLAALLPDGDGRPDRGGGLATWGTLTVLARLDAVFLVVPPLLIRACDRQRAGGARWPGMVASLFALGVVLVLYMAVNASVFGHSLPISGMIKGSFSEPVVPRFGAASRFCAACRRSRVR